MIGKGVALAEGQKNNAGEAKTLDETDQMQRKGSWWRILLVGLLLYVVGIALLISTGNPNLFPTVVMVGNFLVPVTYVAFFYERRHLSTVTMPTTAMSFFWGGVLGVFAASLLEPLLISGLSVSTLLLVGLIEEFCKILGVLVIARHRRHSSELNGIIIGVAAGMGFAALESMGYTFTAFLQSQGSLQATVGVTLLRGLLAPVGHGTWTAILAGVLFLESRNGYFRLNLKVLGAYLVVSVLHWLWDALPIFLTATVGSGTDVAIGQAAVGAVGFLILWRRWREAKRLQIASNVPAA